MGEGDALWYLSLPTLLKICGSLFTHIHFFWSDVRLTSSCRGKCHLDLMKFCWMEWGRGSQGATSSACCISYYRMFFSFWEARHVLSILCVRRGIPQACLTLIYPQLGIHLRQRQAEVWHGSLSSASVDSVPSRAACLRGCCNLSHRMSVDLSEASPRNGSPHVQYGQKNWVLFCLRGEAVLLKIFSAFLNFFAEFTAILRS